MRRGQQNSYEETAAHSRPQSYHEPAGVSPPPKDDFRELISNIISKKEAELSDELSLLKRVGKNGQENESESPLALVESAIESAKDLQRLCSAPQKEQGRRRSLLRESSGEMNPRETLKEAEAGSRREAAKEILKEEPRRQMVKEEVTKKEIQREEVKEEVKEVVKETVKEEDVKKDMQKEENKEEAKEVTKKDLQKEEVKEEAKEVAKKDMQKEEVKEESKKDMHKEEVKEEAKETNKPEKVGLKGGMN